jgi:hypothetical protein
MRLKLNVRLEDNVMFVHVRGVGPRVVGQRLGADELKGHHGSVDGSRREVR